MITIKSILRRNRESDSIGKKGVKSVFPILHARQRSKPYHQLGAKYILSPTKILLTNIKIKCIICINRSNTNNANNATVEERNKEMPELKELLPFIIPIIIAELILLVYTLRHILTHEHYKHGNRTIWVIICFIGMEFIGPILYFLLGKEDS